MDISSIKTKKELDEFIKIKSKINLQNKYSIGELEACLFYQNSIDKYGKDFINYIVFMEYCLKEKLKLDRKLDTYSTSKDWMDGYISTLDILKTIRP